MKKNITILRLAKRISLVLLFSLITILTACGNEDKYEKAISLLTDDKVYEAKKVLNEIEIGYKDVNILMVYSKAYIEADFIEDSGDYSSVLHTLHKGIPEDYDGEIKSKIEELKETLLKRQSEYEEQLISDVEAILKQDVLIEEYLYDALEKINKVNQFKDAETIKHYIQARIQNKRFIDTKEWDDVYEKYTHLTKIDPEYDGVLAEEIIGYINWHGGMEAIKKEMREIRGYIAFENSLPSPPKIGMTAEEVRESSWGEPLEINRTTTQYSVSEQWVYYGYKYIYLEDGRVTSIHE